MKKYVLIYGLVVCVLAGCQSNEPAESGLAAPDSLQEDTTAADTSLDFSAAGLQEDEVRAFLSTLQQAVSQGDRQRVAALVAYPITVGVDGEEVTLRRPADFTARYDQIMNQHIRSAVQQARIEELFVNWQGVRIGQGAVWFGGVYEDDAATTYDVRIVAFNP